MKEFLEEAKGSCVVHVGAGLSTSAGIRDFRGKEGVWTELLKNKQHAQKKQKLSENSDSAKQISIKNEITDSCCEIKSDKSDTKTPESSIEPVKRMQNFDNTIPTIGHLALKALCERGYIAHIISQNVDGLFLKSNLNRKYISELHGNFYLDECKKCRSRYIRSTASKTMRLQTSDKKCSKITDSKRFKQSSGQEEEKKATICNGYLRDTILDWDSSIPYNELKTAENNSKKCDLHICIGTSLQLRPSRDLVCTKRKKTNQKKKLVIINLQPTKFDKDADLIINYYSDDVMKELAKQMEFEIPKYNPKSDPTKDADSIGTMWTKKG